MKLFYHSDIRKTKDVKQFADSFINFLARDSEEEDDRPEFAGACSGVLRKNLDIQLSVIKLIS